MNEENKINLVNPLNPNEIIKTEILTPKVNEPEINEPEIVEDNIEKPQIEEEKTIPNKKKFNIIIIIAVVAIIAILGIVIFILTKDKEPVVNDNTPNNNTPNDQINTSISAQNISDIYNQNITNYTIGENTTTNCEIVDNNIRVNVNMPEYALIYEFIITDRTLSAIVNKSDELSHKLAIYIISSIAQYHGINFNDSVNYLSNISSFNEVNNIEVIDFEQIQEVKINLDEKMIIQ